MPEISSQSPHICFFFGQPSDWFATTRWAPVMTGCRCLNTGNNLFYKSHLFSTQFATCTLPVWLYPIAPCFALQAASLTSSCITGLASVQKVCVHFEMAADQIPLVQAVCSSDDHSSRSTLCYLLFARHAKKLYSHLQLLWPSKLGTIAHLNSLSIRAAA